VTISGEKIGFRFGNSDRKDYARRREAYFALQKATHEMERSFFFLARLYMPFVVDIEGRTGHDGLHGVHQKSLKKHAILMLLWRFEKGVPFWPTPPVYVCNIILEQRRRHSVVGRATSLRFLSQLVLPRS
jgi:hypothetical protein